MTSKDAIQPTTEPDAHGVQDANCSPQDAAVPTKWARLRKRAVRMVAGGLLLWIFMIAIASLRTLPPGTHTTGPWHAVVEDSVSFLADLTYPSSEETLVREQVIFDALFSQIQEAESFLVLDFFLINDFAGDPESAPRSLSRELIDALIASRLRQPTMPILLVTDPINRVYGGERHPGFERLQQHGIEVVETRLEKLRDSNPTYSVVYRTLFNWFGNAAGGGFVPNPFDPDDDTTVRSWLRLLNFKANHRKLAISGHNDGTVTGLVASANPHDASSGHSNVALRFNGGGALDLLASEIEVARFSGANPQVLDQIEQRSRDTESRARGTELSETVRPAPLADPSEHGIDLQEEDTETEVAARVGTEVVSQSAASATLQLRVVSEAAIRDGLLQMLNRLKEGDDARLAMFYMGHRGVVEALLGAAKRGARVRLILDSNRDAFGREKGGIPNRSVAHELVRRSKKAATQGQGLEIEVRWYNTSGEQFHTKLASTTLRCCEPTQAELLLGSANYTRRNIDDFNLETNVQVRMPKDSSLAHEVSEYFERLWTNQDGQFTLDYASFADESALSAIKYRLMERTGLSTF